MSKHVGELLSEMYCTIWSVNVTNVRFFNVYGPGEADYGSFTTLLKQCKKGYVSKKGFYIEGDGGTIRDFTHVDDVCRGLIATIGDARPLIELGSGEAHVTVKDIVEEFCVGSNLTIEWRPARMGDPIYTNADPSLFPEGWKQEVDVLEYIREWKRNGCVDD